MQKQADKVEKERIVERSKDFKARGIPDPTSDVKGYNFDDAVSLRISEGNYDAAIEGLQSKLDDYKKGPTASPKKIKEQEDDIKRLQVTKEGNFDPSVIDIYKDTNLTEWRDMGNPESEFYNPELYQKLWDYDTALANAAVSKNDTSADKNFYSAKKSSSGSASKGVPKNISSNTVGTPQSLGKVNLSKIVGRSTNTAPLTKISRLKPGELIKRRKISVSKGI
jgi:hypothetical protein